MNKNAYTQTNFQRPHFQFDTVGLIDHVKLGNFTTNQLMAECNARPEGLYYAQLAFFNVAKIFRTKSNSESVCLMKFHNNVLSQSVLKMLLKI